MADGKKWQMTNGKWEMVDGKNSDSPSGVSGSGSSGGLTGNSGNERTGSSSIGFLGPKTSTGPASIGELEALEALDKELEIETATSEGTQAIEKENSKKDEPVETYRSSYNSGSTYYSCGVGGDV